MQQYLTLKYYYKITSQLDNSAFNMIVDMRLSRNKRIEPPLAIRAQELLEKLNISTSNICSAFSYPQLHVNKLS